MESSSTDLSQDYATDIKKEENEMIEDFSETNKEEIKEEILDEAGITSLSRKSNKRKRRHEENGTPIHLLTEVFLRLIYPLSTYLSKSIAVGIFKSWEYKPAVVISHHDKQIVLSENTWNSLKNYLNLIDCYLLNKVFGRKTSVRLASSDIEVDNIKSRGDQCIRFRNLTKHDVKVHLTVEEFHMLKSAAPAIDRYIQQLNSCEAIVKDYLLDAIENSSDSPIIYGPIDSCIYNRIPQEVNLYREMKSLSLKTIIQEISNSIYSCEEELTEKEISKSGEISESEVD
jgi:hypothetical protein